ncbi:hypothetical protein AVO42_05240 [Thiomicrospira sp. XS5]|uniref:hypothetical protein n=1 Tax=Thiomicrospira sp. XS5 TaxID=1775636 RepID=UPI0007477FEC|nr:hypothetical protein [Thiomicrospira sp. XS5]KUJ74794.1 hypothetical protein AVO42_05240 [Thiomicrospira sp. XS5]
MRLVDSVWMRRYLAWPLGVLAATLLFIVLSGWFLTQQEARLQSGVQQKVAQLDRLVQQVAFLNRQERLFLAYGESYSEINPEDLVDQQGRVAWTDALLNIQKSLVLSPFKIQFEPEKPLQQSELKYIPLEKPIFFFTRLNLTAGLQSDRDIITLFQRISADITPFFLIDRCDLDKGAQARTPVFNLDKGGIHLQCSLIFFEAKPRAFKGQAL